MQPVRQIKIELKRRRSVKEEKKRGRKRARKEGVSRCEEKKRRRRGKTLLNYIAVAFQRRADPTPELLFPLCPEHLWLPPTCHLPCNELSIRKPGGEIRVLHENEPHREATR